MSGGDGFDHRPLADLVKLRGNLPPGPEPAAPPSTSSPSGESPGDPSAKVVLRRERKKRGGKTVTRVEGLEAATRPATAKELAKALGCGSSLEGDDVLLQGDHVARAARWLRERGVGRVVEGN